MIKRIEKWLAGIFKAELKTVEADAAGLYAHLTSEIHELRNELATVIRGFQDAAEERASALKSHVDGAAEKITTDVAADAKVISLFRHMQRLACALCGQMSGTYEIIEGKTICLDCRAKGRTA